MHWKWVVRTAIAAATAASSNALILNQLPKAATQSTQQGGGYVDSAVCAGCHGEIAKTYAMTGMGRSLYRLEDSNRVEDFETNNTFVHKASGSHYQMTERDGKFYERRSQNL